MFFVNRHIPEPIVRSFSRITRAQMVEFLVRGGAINHEESQLEKQSDAQILGLYIFAVRVYLEFKARERQDQETRPACHYRSLVISYLPVPHGWSRGLGTTPLGLQSWVDVYIGEVENEVSKELLTDFPDLLRALDPNVF